MTNREFYNVIINGNGSVTDKNADGTKGEVRTIDLMIDGSINPEIIEFAKESVTKLDNKNANRKDSKATLEKRAEDELKMEILLNAMQSGTTYSSAMLTEMVQEDLPEIKQSKVTALLKKLAENGKISTVQGFKPAKGKSKCTGYIK